jgi:hypothetical protein
MKWHTSNESCTRTFQGIGLFQWQGHVRRGIWSPVCHPYQSLSWRRRGVQVPLQGLDRLRALLILDVALIP